MSTTTENYGLHQWEPEDNFLRTDFNEDNAKIENALTALAAGQVQIASGTYTGTGTFEPNEIYLGFQPEALLLFSHSGEANVNGYLHGGLVLRDYPLQNTAGQYAAQITQTGFMVRHSDSYRSLTNVNGIAYYYLALKW